jgi:hypothetical protein
MDYGYAIESRHRFRGEKPVAEKPTTFPRLPLGAWWGLRKKFVQSLPGIVTTSYVATVLNMQEESARANVLPFLKTLGLIDEEGRVTDLSRRWRDDHQYAAVCREMLETVYPEELRHAASDPSQRPQAERWFANATGAGQAAARMMTSVYVTLLEADASKQPDSKAERTPKTNRANPKSPTKGKNGQPVPPPPAPLITPPPPPQPPHQNPVLKELLPGININLEIHISADSTPEQIEKIFESMSKHIYRNTRG